MHKKEMLESDLVRKFRKEEWHVLFTPPYCPDLQPIELFWAAGKNWARYLNTEHRRSIEKCIEDLRAGWYGDGKKEPGGYAKLVTHNIKNANGTTMPREEEATYLRANITKKHLNRKEIDERLRQEEEERLERKEEERKFKKLKAIEDNRKKQKAKKDQEKREKAKDQINEFLYENK